MISLSNNRQVLRNCSQRGMHRRHHMLDYFHEGAPSLRPTYCVTSDFPNCNGCLPPYVQQTTNEGTLQPARRSNLQAVEKSVTTPNQTARSVFFYIYIIIICALSILLSDYDTSFVLIPSCPPSNLFHISR